MKEKIKNFLLKIKELFYKEHSFKTIELIIFCVVINFLTMFLCVAEIMSTDSCFNETHSTQVENVEADRYIIDRDIKGANPTQNDYVNPSVNYTYIYFNPHFNDISIFDSLTFFNILGVDGYPIYLTASNNDNNQPTNNRYSLLYIAKQSNSTFPYVVYYSVLERTGSTLNDAGYYYQVAQFNENGNYNINSYVATRFSNPTTLFLGQLPIGSQNNLLYNFVSTKPFESDSSIVDTSILTLNVSNFDGAINFSTFLTKETISGYFSQLTYESTNFITPSLTLTDVESYTIITGRIGTPPISNYIPSLVVVKYDSKYVVYNYLRDNYLTPIYDTSIGVLENVLGDGNYFLNVFSPTYFGSENDKFNLFISAVNIADSPLYSLISIGYDNGYEFGYDRGFSVGEHTGFVDGEESGFNEGYDTGYENGFNEGRDTANALGPVMSLFKDTADVVASVLNVQILPNLTIGTILLFPLVALLFALFVRLFFGG